MKKEFVRTTLEPKNEAEVNQYLETPNGLTVYSPIIIGLAQILDEAVKGENVWVNVGLDRGKTAIVFTVRYGGTPMYISGSTLAEVASEFDKLL